MPELDLTGNRAVVARCDRCEPLRPEDLVAGDPGELALAVARLAQVLTDSDRFELDLTRREEQPVLAGLGVGDDDLVGVDEGERRNGFGERGPAGAVDLDDIENAGPEHVLDHLGRHWCSATFIRQRQGLLAELREFTDGVGRDEDNGATHVVRPEDQQRVSQDLLAIVVDDEHGRARRHERLEPGRSRIIGHANDLSVSAVANGLGPDICERGSATEQDRP